MFKNIAVYTILLAIGLWTISFHVPTKNTYADSGIVSNKVDGDPANMRQAALLVSKICPENTTGSVEFNPRSQDGKVFPNEFIVTYTCVNK